MSRETDSSSSGPNGRGGTAYPSGTPPYGTPTGSEDGADAGRSAGERPEEVKTETTLTTRIRINIPGSRPIPPVVVRTPVADAEKSDNGSKSTNGANGSAGFGGFGQTGFGCGRSGAECFLGCAQVPGTRAVFRLRRCRRGEDERLVRSS